MSTPQLASHPGDHSPLADKAAMKTATHVSEGGHWYNKQAQQIETVLSADGKRQVKCTLAHARKLNLGPGITTIIGTADKPALTQWLITQGIMSALTLPRLTTETEKEWLDRVRQDMKRQSQEAAEEGTRIHTALQTHFQGKLCDVGYAMHVQGVIERLPSAQPWRTEIAVAHPDGYGTKIDLVSDDYLLDFKGKDGDQEALDALDVYDEHAMQLAAGQQAIMDGMGSGLAAKERRCGIVFVSRTHPGAASARWLEDKDIVRGWEMFQCLLHYWQKKTGHKPKWSEQ